MEGAIECIGLLHYNSVHSTTKLCIKIKILDNTIPTLKYNVLYNDAKHKQHNPPRPQKHEPNNYRRQNLLHHLSPFYKLLPLLHHLFERRDLQALHDGDISKVGRKEVQEEILVAETFYFDRHRLHRLHLHPCRRHTKHRAMDLPRVHVLLLRVPHHPWILRLHAWRPRSVARQ